MLIINKNTKKILNEFKKLNLYPLSVMHKDFTNNIANFYCRIFIKDSIYVIAKIDELRKNIKSTLGDNYDLSWIINNKNSNIIEIIILKK